MSRVWSFDIDEAERLYRDGLSARAVAAAVGSNRESIRLAMAERGVIRGRLERRQDSVPRIMERVDINGPNGCWLWTGSKNNKGYGQCVLHGRKLLAHRAVYEIHRGPPPAEATDACHRCDNPICVNPAHIFFATHRDNMRDASQKRRLQHGEAHTHAVLSEAKIREAHRLWRNGASIAEAANATGIWRQHLWSILHGKSWRHLELEGVR